MGGHTDQGLLAFIYLTRTADFCHSHDAPGPGIWFLDWVRHTFLSGASKSRGNKALASHCLFLFPWRVGRLTSQRPQPRAPVS